MIHPFDLWTMWEKEATGVPWVARAPYSNENGPQTIIEQYNGLVAECERAEDATLIATMRNKMTQFLAVVRAAERLNLLCHEQSQLIARSRYGKDPEPCNSCESCLLRIALANLEAP